MAARAAGGVCVLTESFESVGNATAAALPTAMTSATTPLLPRPRTPSSPGNIKEADRPVRRCVSFVAFHCLFFWTQVGILGLFFVNSCFGFMVPIALTMLFSAVVYTHVAMFYQAPLSCEFFPCMPLREKNFLVAVLLWLLLSVCQGVVVVLAVEDCLAQRSARTRALSDPSPLSHRTRSHANMVSHKHNFTCKPIISIFEGIAFASVLLYACWGINFPAQHPIIESDDPDSMLYVLSAAAVLALFVGGTGLVESDLCLSDSVSDTYFWRILHWTFRATEVAHRMALHVYIMSDLWAADVPLFFAPLLADFFVTVSLVYCFGGCEGHFLLRFLCGMPCVFADLFFFVDVPAKRLPARRMSELFLMRNLLMAVVGGYVLAFDWVGDGRRTTSLKVCLPAVPYVFLWGVFRLKRSEEVPDIFEPCVRGNAPRVVELTNKNRCVIVDVNLYNIDGLTPVMLGARSGKQRMDVCQALVDQGARVDIPAAYDTRILRRLWSRQVRRRWTVLHMAARRGDSSLLKVLLKAQHMMDTRRHLNANLGTDMSSGSSSSKQRAMMLRDTLGRSPLHEAVRFGHHEAAKLIAEVIPELLKFRDGDGKLPVDHAKSTAIGNVVAVSQYDTYLRKSPLREAGPGPQQLLERTSSTFAITNSTDNIFSLGDEETQDAAGTSAPGLSSFLVGVAGGVQGQLFLAHLAAVPEETVAVPVDEPAMTNSVNIEDLEPVHKKDGIMTPGIMEHIESCNDLNALLTKPMVESAILGSGNFCEVWRARDRNNPTNDIQYAVKTVRFAPGPRANVIQQREADVYRKINVFPHPCCMELLALHKCTVMTPRFTWMTSVSLVMELCPNGDLSRGLQAGLYRVGNAVCYKVPQQAARWMGETFLGLEHLHLQVRALMRDVKPGNVLLDANLHCKISDFGFSKIGTHFTGWTSFLSPTGTPGYAAPEVMAQDKGDWACDIYSLGVLVWVAFSGGDSRREPLLPPASEGRTYDAHVRDWERMEEVLARPKAFTRATVPEDVLEFVRETTHRNPRERLQHIGIRQSPFMERLGLPEKGDIPACREWLMGHDPVRTADSRPRARMHAPSHA